MNTDKIGVLIVHGMGSQKEDFATAMIAELQQRLKTHRSRFVFQPVFWAADLMAREGRLLDKLSSAQDPSGDKIGLEWMRTREFVLHNFGDAVAYQRHNDPGRSGVYHQIHQIVSAGVVKLKSDLPSPDCPIVVMAHSLGGHIMSNYIWDHQPDASGEVPVTGYEPLLTLTAMITFGCNIPLFSLSFDTATPIDLPGGGVTKPALVAASRWLNFLDVDDVLGWPLRPLYEKDLPQLSMRQQGTVARIHDHAINVGGLLESWNPVAHSAYWEDNDFTEPVADYLLFLREALDA